MKMLNSVVVSVGQTKKTSESATHCRIDCRFCSHINFIGRCLRSKVIPKVSFKFSCVHFFQEAHRGKIRVGCTTGSREIQFERVNKKTSYLLKCNHVKSIPLKTSFAMHLICKFVTVQAGSRINGSPDQGSRIKDQGSRSRIKDQGSRIKDQGLGIKDH